MKTHNYLWYGCLLLLCAWPVQAVADGVSPLLNIFHKDMIVPATIVTIVIILVETLLLRWRIKEVPFPGALWRSAVINVASSATGSVLLLALGRDSFFMWDTMSLVLPLFVITLATEIPLLRLLYRSIRMSGLRAVRLSLLINALSYLVVFVLEIGLFIGWSFYAGHVDSKEMAAWSHPEMLHQSSGQIWTMDSDGRGDHLRRFDVQDGSWHAVSNSPSVDPNQWDVEGNLCAFVRSGDGDRQDRSLQVAALPGFVTIRTCSQTSLVDEVSNTWQGITDLKISPDRSKVALLFRVAEAVAYRNESSYYDLGSKCRLLVLEIGTGRIMTTGARWASDRGLCWFPDSTSVVFPSFRNEALYRTGKLDVRGGMSYGIGYEADTKFACSLYVLNIRTAAIDHLADGYLPVLQPAGNSIVFRVPDGIQILDLATRRSTAMQIKNLGLGSVWLSPDGGFLLAGINRHAPFGFASRLVVIDRQHGANRHVIDKQSMYRFVWTASDNGNASARPPAPANPSASAPEPQHRMPSATNAMLTPIGHLKTRDKLVTMQTGPAGPLYTVRSNDGTVLAADLPATALSTKFPELKGVVEHGVADWAGLDPTLRGHQGTIDVSPSSTYDTEPIIIEHRRVDGPSVMAP